MEDDKFNSNSFHRSVKPSESPFYYWPGGEQPVPDNCEVEVVYRIGGKFIGSAGKREWRHIPRSGDIIAFRLTGKCYE